MEIEYDAAKSRRNVKDRGLGFDQARELLEGDPLTVEDTRRDYRERRFIAYGLIRARLHVCVYTVRGEIFRIISLRRANRREIDAFGKDDLCGGTQASREGAR
jgi:hypothetical protein